MIELDNKAISDIGQSELSCREDEGYTQAPLSGHCAVPGQTAE